MLVARQKENICQQPQVISYRRQLAAAHSRTAWGPAEHSLPCSTAQADTRIPAMLQTIAVPGTEQWGAAAQGVCGSSSTLSAR